MFKVIQKESVKWPVTVQVPVDGGRTQPHHFEVEVRLMKQDEIDATLSHAQGGAGDIEFLLGAVVNWDGVADEVGTAIPCTDEEKRRIFAVPYVRKGVMDAFFEANTGRAAARKNL